MFLQRCTLFVLINIYAATNVYHAFLKNALEPEMYIDMRKGTTKSIYLA